MSDLAQGQGQGAQGRGATAPQAPGGGGRGAAPQGRGGARGGGGGGGFGGGAAGPFTPDPTAKDLKSVLFNWTWHLGMLRGVDEHELIVSLEYQGKGTVQVDGQPCPPRRSG